MSDPKRAESATYDTYEFFEFLAGVYGKIMQIRT